jgi:citrate lyase subunit beta/citryl-CoA lyase
MSKTFHPRRSVLYMPGANARAMDKARELPADCVIFDLEDAVAPEAKEEARSKAAAAVRAGGYARREVIIRTNGTATEWFADDLAAVAGSAPHAMLLPKVDSPAMLKEALRDAGRAGVPADLPVWIMIETPRGVQNLAEILAGEPRIEAVVMGTSDLAKEMRLPADAARTGLMHAMGSCVLAARAQGVDIIDGVHLALDDADGFRMACQQGRNLGFDGKSLIHPSQIDTANEYFGVSATEAEAAAKIVAAWKAARSEGKGITVVDGRLIEQLHVDDAERKLALFEATR